VLIAALIGVPTLRPFGPLLLDGDDRRGRTRARARHQLGVGGGAQGISGPAVPRTVLDLSFISAMPYYYIFLTVLAAILFSPGASRRAAWASTCAPSRTRARGTLARRRRRPLQALRLHAERRPHRGRRLALCHHVRLRDPESGCGILISVKMLIMAALGGAACCSGRWWAR
jgi:branched-chain amino acid transport system permease protein